MDTNTLRTFVTLAEIKSFTRTAKMMFVSQSTITNRVRELEKELDAQLFSREYKQIELTEAGENFLPYARKIIALELSSRQTLHTLPDTHRIIRLGTTNMLYDCYVAKPLARYLAEPEADSIILSIRRTPDLLELLKEGNLDAMISFSPYTSAQTVCRPFRKDQLVLVAPPDDASHAEGITRDQLPSLPYLYCNFSLHGLGIFIRDLFPKNHIFPLEIDNSTKLLPLVQQGVGCTFLPRIMAAEALQEGSIREIPLLDAPLPGVASFYVTRKPSGLPKEMERLLGI